jgi:inorganic pyrophosphatase
MFVRYQQQQPFHKSSASLRSIINWSSSISPIQSVAFATKPPKLAPQLPQQQQHPNLQASSNHLHPHRHQTPTSTFNVAPRPNSITSNSTPKPNPRVELLAAHFSTNSALKMPSFGVRKIGAPNTLEHRVFIEADGHPISAFHDVPLYANEQQTILNMIVEIPRWTNAKLEVCYVFSSK